MKNGIAIVETAWITSLKKVGGKKLNAEPIAEDNPVAKVKIKTEMIDITVAKNLKLLLTQAPNPFLPIGNFSNSLATVIPVIVAQVEPNKEVAIIIVGSALPGCGTHRDCSCGNNCHSSGINC